MFFGRSKSKRKEPEPPRRPEPRTSDYASSASKPRVTPVRTAMSRAAAPGKKLIGQLLVEEGLISNGQLEEALENQKKSGKKIVETLVELGSMRQADFEHLMGRQPGVASIDLDNYKVPRELAEMIPRDFALRHQVFPIDKLGKLLTVGMACPLDTQTVGSVEEHTGLCVKPLLCSLDDILDCIREYYPKENNPTEAAP